MRHSLIAAVCRMMSALALLAAAGGAAFATAEDRPSEVRDSAATSSDWRPLAGRHAPPGSVEIVEARRYNAKEWRYPDGSRHAHVYGGPVHYRAADGRWLDIDENFHPAADGSVSVREGIYEAKINRDASGAARARLSMEGETLETRATSWGWYDPAADRFLEVGAFNLGQPEASGNAAMLRDAGGEVSVRYTYHPTRLKEEIEFSEAALSSALAALGARWPGVSEDEVALVVRCEISGADAPAALIPWSESREMAVGRAMPRHIPGGSPFSLTRDDAQRGEARVATSRLVAPPAGGRREVLQGVRWTRVAGATGPLVIDPTVQVTVTAGDDDGSVQGYDATVYANARVNANDAVPSNSSDKLGQTYPGSYYQVFRSFFNFDSSAYTTATAAALRLYSGAGLVGPGFDIYVFEWTGTPPLAQSQFNNFGATLFASINTSVFSTTGYNSFALNGSGLAKVNAAAPSRFCLRSSRDVSSVAPTGWEYVDISMVDTSGTTQDPFLDVTLPPIPGYWTGAISGDWGTASNWDDSAVPTVSTDVTIPPGAPNAPTVSANVSCKSVTIQAGATLVQTGGVLSVAGNWTNNGTFSSTGGTVEFLANAAISGSATHAYKSLTIATAYTLTLPASLSMQGTLTVNGTLAAGSGTITFTTGASTITGTGTLALNSIVVNSGATLTLPSASLTVTGAITNNGTVSAGTGTVVFTGTSANLSGTGAHTYYGLTVQSGATFTAPSAFTVRNLTIDGTFSAGTGTVTFSTAGTLLGTGTKAFNNVVNSGTFTLPSTGSVSVSGNWTMNGSVTAGTCTVDFAGATTLSGNGPFQLSSVIINGSLTAPAQNLVLSGSWTNNGTFNASNGTVSFNSAGATFGGSNPLVFHHLRLNAAGITLPPLITVTGDFDAPSGFTHNSGKIAFAGSDVQMASTGGSNFFDLEVNGTGNTVRLLGPTVVAGTLTLTSGTVRGTASAGTWWNTSWRQRIKITLDNAARGSLSNFPVTVRLDETRVPFNRLGPNGEQIRFVDSNHVTTLAYEIAWFNTTVKKAECHVNVPLVDAGSQSDHFFMYFDSPGATDAQTPTSVWSSYEAVYHLSETSGTYKDSSPNNRLSTAEAVTSRTATGFAGAPSPDFDGVDDIVSVGTYGFNGTVASVEVFFKPSSYPAADMFLAGKAGSSTPAQRRWMLALNYGASHFLESTAYAGGAAGTQLGATPVSGTSTWFYGAMDFSSSTIRTYLNGALDGSAAKTGTMTNDSTAVSIGRYNSSEDPFAGIIEEVRFSTVAQNADWFSATNATFRDSMQTYGSVEVYQTGSADLTLNTATIGPGGTLSLDGVNLSLSGSSITNNGALRQTGTAAGTTTISSTVTLAGTGEYKLRDLTINTASTLNAPPGVLGVSGNLTNTGTLVPGAGTVAFQGATIVTGTPSFHTVQITGAVTFPASALNVSGDFVNNGTFTQGNGTVNFNGTSRVLGGSVTLFNAVVISGSATLTGHPVRLEVQSWENNGAFLHNSGEVRLNGSPILRGNSTFFRLVCIGQGGAVIGVQAGTTQAVTSLLRFQGMSGDPMYLQGLTATAFTLNLAAGAQSIDFVNVGDCTATGNALTVNGGSDLGNNTNVIFNGVTSRYWVGGTGVWSDTAHWSATSNGAGGASVPDSASLVTFDSFSGGGTTTLDQNVNVKEIVIAAATLSQSTFSITVGTGGLTVSGGTFVGGSGPIAVNGSFTVASGFTSTSGSLTLSGSVSMAAFTHNNGTVVFAGSYQTVPAATYYNLTKNAAGADTLFFVSTQTVTVAGTLTLAGTANDRLQLRSTVSGTQWNINPQGTRAISYLDVKDSNNTNGTPVDTDFTSSVSGGNNTGWLFPGAWTAPAGADWNTGSNWGGGSAPTAITTVVIPAGTAGPTLAGSSGVAGDVAVGAGGNLTVDGVSLTVSGTTEVTGTVVVKSGGSLVTQNLVLKPGAVIEFQSGATLMVWGNLINDGALATGTNPVSLTGAGTQVVGGISDTTFGGGLQVQGTGTIQFGDGTNGDRTTKIEGAFIWTSGNIEVGKAGAPHVLQVPAPLIQPPGAGLRLAGGSRIKVGW